MSVGVDTGEVLTVGTPRVVFEARLTAGPGAPSFDVTADGERFLIVESSENERAQLHVVVNWSEELKRLVPTDN